MRRRKKVRARSRPGSGGGGGGGSGSGSGGRPEREPEADTDRDVAPQLPPKNSLLDVVDTDDRYRRFLVGNENYQTKGRIKKDGRLRITVDETRGTGYIAKALGAAVSRMKPPLSPPAVCGGPGKKTRQQQQQQQQQQQLQSTPAESGFKMEDLDPLPRLNIVIMVIGSRGDVQPFLKIGKMLKEDYGHRVRIATHPTFRDYVERDSGLEFFSVGGDPSELMAFMVKNPGMIPTLETVRAGDIGKRRAAMAAMFQGFWRACVQATDDEADAQNLKMLGAKEPFVADAIIANPPSFAHVHCAEALGIPLHLMFTFPYSPTQAFPHPLASIKRSNVDPGYTNFISYPMVEMMVWQGLGDLINDFRVKTLALDPVSTLWAPGTTYRLRVPFTYLWSPGLVPKPRDWGDNIDISGFVYLDLASTYRPPAELEAFLADRSKPIVYIGFGSIVVDDADKFTDMIFEAVRKAGVRALVSRGWGGFGGDGGTPGDVLMLGNSPHDWLFPRVDACVIHGGAGTTAIALKTGRPTMVVPFFGDQHFWGNMVSNAKVGPEPVHHRSLTADKLADGIAYCLTREARDAAAKIAEDIALEGDGATNAVLSFHRHLNLAGPAPSMRCSILKDQVAAWQVRGTDVKLSPLAADILVDTGVTSWRKLRLLRHTEWNDFAGPGGPFTAVAGSLGHTARTVGLVAPLKLAKSSKKYKRRLAEKRRKRLSGSTIATTTDDPATVAGHVRNSTTTASSAGSTAVTATTTTTAAGAGAGTGAGAGEVGEDITLVPTWDIHGEFIGDVTLGVGKTASALAMAPVDLSVALAQGFHNAPRLYGDDTVRRPVRITGIQSGLEAAGKEFVYGVYDAFSGLVVLPYRGARDDGLVGFTKGAGMGFMGLMVKNVAAVLGPLGYTLKGLAKQVERSSTKSPTALIRRARIAQGQRATHDLPPDEREALVEEVVAGRYVMKALGEAIAADAQKRGIAGRWDRFFGDVAPLFEDVQVAQGALDALRRGVPLDVLVRRPAVRSHHRSSVSWRDRLRARPCDDK
ncbi:Glycosyltransferase family 28 N-terminal domain [Geosmithia morbida]|uniref:Glycosyltransferase family 28 N-terminal domain n=1 Tax=Geosmithia morbida TaxID=1094350 RepID=A0A9P4YY49_9HYPO|nr:Glycosyltransferase family 28 N-terminal domain [Geosmithia morbida]KAF4123134.1 Glycosyltransferase family 28 N-terminal domain [Geosmithia morbida]